MEKRPNREEDRNKKWYDFCVVKTRKFIYTFVVPRMEYDVGMGEWVGIGPLSKNLLTSKCVSLSVTQLWYVSNVSSKTANLSASSDFINTSHYLQGTTRNATRQNTLFL